MSVMGVMAKLNVMPSPKPSVVPSRNVLPSPSVVPRLDTNVTCNDAAVMPSPSPSVVPSLSVVPRRNVVVVLLKKSAIC